MKKHSIFLRASGVLLALTLATSCFVGGTFAKYVTSKNITVDARVAKWGVELTAPAPENQGFYTTYTANTTSEDILNELELADGKRISVKANANVNVVAPGTKGTFTGIKVDANAPEVAYQVTTTADEVLITNWTVDDDFYCPLIFTVCGTKIDGSTYTDVNLLINDIQKAIQEDPSSNFVGQAGESYFSPDISCAGRISWEWPFEGDEGGAATTGQNDTKDTALGQLLADGNFDNDPSISIKITTTVTQID